MPLMTRCSHCRTVFRITPEQLRAHGGQVRCGRCLQVFNGLETLVPDAPAGIAEPAVVGAEAAAPTPTPMPVAEAPVQPAETEQVVAKTVQETAVPATVEMAAVQPAAPAELIELLPEPPAAVAPETAALPAAGTEAAEPVAASTEAVDNPFMQEAEAAPQPAPRRKWPAAASVLLAVALGLQAVYFYRSDIAAHHPPARQWLDAACAQLGCTVSLPQLPKSVLIEASDLQLLDPARPERIQLTATLRNHAGHAVAYPALDLVLTNANDHTLARRIFLPAEYLGNGRDPRGGLAAHAELTVRLALDTGSLGAAGFRLAVLAAPR